MEARPVPLLAELTHRLGEFADVRHEVSIGAVGVRSGPLLSRERLDRLPHPGHASTRTNRFVLPGDCPCHCCAPPREVWPTCRRPTALAPFSPSRCPSR